jgi:hypothetical protein
MLHRPLAILAALALALALPVASAHASDPLLSGYAGPGGGEQVVLGGATVGKAKGSSSAQDPANADLKADTTRSATDSEGANSTLTPRPQRQKPSSSTSKDKGDDDGQSATNGGTTTTATLPGAPAVVAYPTRADDVGDLPVAAPGLLLIVLGVAAATLVGLGLRRLSGSERASDPQVSVR